MARVVGLLLVLVATRAGADPSQVSTLNWMFNGAVQGAARVGNTLYVGGTFTSVSPSSAALGSFYRLSTSTGLVESPSMPLVDGVVMAVLDDGAGGFYIGGAFAKVGGVVRPHLAHIMSDGTLDPDFAPTINGSVSSIGRVGASLFVAGGFTVLGNVSQAGLGAVDATTGARVAWTADAPATFRPGQILTTPDRVIVAATDTQQSTTTAWFSAYSPASGAVVWRTSFGPTSGPFPSIPSVAGPMVLVGTRLIASYNAGVASISVNSGAVDAAWNPGVTQVNALATAGPTVYIGGSFSSLGGQPRNGLGAVDVNTAAVQPWQPPSAAVSRLVVSPTGSVFVAGFFSSIGGLPRHRLAEVDAAGNVTTWVSEAMTDFVTAMAVDSGGRLLVGSRLAAGHGVARQRLAAFDLTTGGLLPWAPATDFSVNAVAVSGEAVLVSGSFSSVNGQPRSRFAAVDRLSGALLGFSPNVTSATILHADVRWVYASVRRDSMVGAAELRRFEVGSGAEDPHWIGPSGNPLSLVLGEGRMYLAGSFVVTPPPGQGCPCTSGLLTIDAVTGAVESMHWPRFRGVQLTSLAKDGDTLYVTGGFSALAGVPRLGAAAVDAKSGELLAWNPGAAGRTGANDRLAMADGRVVATELARTETPTVFQLLTAEGQAVPWNPPYSGTITSGPAPFVGAFGDVLVAGGTFGTLAPTPLQGLAVFPLAGASVPRNLSARPRGPSTVFSWDPPLALPPGGFVLEGGGAAGRVDATFPIGSAAEFAVGVPAGTYWVRVRTSGVPGGNSATNEVTVTGGCAGPPRPPAALRASVAGVALTLSWTPPDGSVAGYVLEAGSAPGLANIASLSLPGAQTSFAATVPPGTYVVRVRASNVCGTSDPSSEVTVSIGAGVSLPGAPSSLSATVTGSRLDLAWAAPSGPVTGYTLEAGSATGLSDLGTFSLGGATTATFTGVPPGLYVVRLRAVNGAGTGAPAPNMPIRVQ